MSRSFKMVTLLAMLENDSLDGADWRNIAAWSLQIIRRDPRLREDVSSRDIGDVQTMDAARWEAYWRKNPIAAWTAEERGGSNAWFRLRGDRFGPAFAVDETESEPLVSLVRELVDYRLAMYLDRPTQLHKIVLPVSHSSGRPIIRFDRQRHPEIPDGVTEVHVDGRTLEAHFVKIALNKVTERGGATNVLPKLLIDWFGDSAGQPGSAFRVILEREGAAWHLRPNSQLSKVPSMEALG